MKRFSKSFTQQEPIPEAAIDAAVGVMRSGRLHRYNVVAGEPGEVAELESEFARYLGLPYCLACASGGYALQLALRASGVEAGTRVLCNSFTLAPVPGALQSVGAIPDWVETSPALTIDLDHLEERASDSSARHLLLSYMRGHMPDMDRLLEICNAHDLCVIEDCAHTMGAAWNGRKSGTFGHVACFSTQSYKHINSGEGGLLVTGDEDLAARAILLSGSYMLFDRHQAAPSPQSTRRFAYDTPNCSGRMDNLRAAVLRPQLETLDDACRRWNALYAALEDSLRFSEHIAVPERPEAEQFVGSSMQFLIPALAPAGFTSFLERCADRGVELKWFGNPLPRGYTSRFDDWRYFSESAELPQTSAVLAALVDMRIPLTFTAQDCELIGEIIAEEAARACTPEPPGATETGA